MLGKRLIFVFSLILLIHLMAVTHSNAGLINRRNNHRYNETPKDNDSVTDSHNDAQIRLAGFNFTHVETPFIIAAFLALTIICKIGNITILDNCLTIESVKSLYCDPVMI